MTRIRKVEEYETITRESSGGMESGGTSAAAEEEEEEEHPLRRLISMLRQIHLLPKFVDVPIGGTLTGRGVSCHVMRILEGTSDRLLSEHNDDDDNNNNNRDRKRTAAAAATSTRTTTTSTVLDHEDAVALRAYRDALTELKACVTSDVRSKSWKNPPADAFEDGLERSEAMMVSVLVLHQPGGLGALGTIPECLVEPLSRHPYVRHVAEVLLHNIRRTILQRFWELYFRPPPQQQQQQAQVGHESNRPGPHEIVEASVRWFPELLVSGENDFTVTHAAASCNPDLISLIPLLARLGLEVGTPHTANHRGGLLQRDGTGRNALRFIAGRVGSPPLSPRSHRRRRRCEESYLEVMKDLRRENLFVKEDIEREGLMKCLLGPLDRHGSPVAYFAEPRFRYLVDWDPGVLSRSVRRSGNDNDSSNNNNNDDNDNGKLPLHYAVHHYPHPDAFRTVLELGTRHFPRELGFLFHEDGQGRTPFELACSKYGKPVVTRIVDGVLLRRVTTTTRRDDDGGDRLTAIDENDDDDDEREFLDALLFLASTDVVHLDGVFTWLRRNPNILLRALRRRRRGRRQPPTRPGQRRRRNRRSPRHSTKIQRKSSPPDT